MHILVAYLDMFHLDMVGRLVKQFMSPRSVVTISKNSEFLNKVNAKDSFDIIFCDGEIWLDSLKASENLRLLGNFSSQLITTVEKLDSLIIGRLIASQASKIIYLPDLLEYLDNAESFDDNSKIYLSVGISRLIDKIPERNHPLHTLTNSEIRTAQWIVQGYGTKEISKALNLSLHTIADHRKRIKERLDIKGGKNQLIQYLSPYMFWLFKRSMPPKN